MQVSSIRFIEDSYKIEGEIEQKVLAEMTPDTINVLLLKTHIVIWSPLQNVAFVDLEMEKQLKSKGIKTFTKDGQEFTIVGLEKEKFVQLVKKICALAKDILLEKHQTKPQGSSKKDVETTTPVASSKAVKEKAEAPVSASRTKLIIAHQSRDFVYRVALAILREVREQAKKKSERDEKTKEEYKRIDLLKIERKCREEEIDDERIIKDEIEKTAEA